MPSTSPARGMRDFLPPDVRRREYVIGVIRAIYQRYGFQPLETPAVENIDTLLGKYGEEGNQLIFKILKRGEHEATGQADLALRYDLTVPLARVVAEHRATLPKYFKRFQIQPVWRADRPARGRFREFYQCDVDAIGSRSPLVEAELCAAGCEVMQALGFADVTLRINHRAILTGVLDAAGIASSKHAEALVALDKLDKIGPDGVAAEFAQRDIPPDAAAILLAQLTAAPIPASAGWADPSAVATNVTEVQPSEAEAPRPQPQEPQTGDARSPQGSAPEGRALAGPGQAANVATLDRLAAFVGSHPAALDGIDNLRRLLELTAHTPAAAHLRVDPSLARGLSYYTGAIMEMAVPDLAGSLGGGGRYDNLVGMFGKEQVPAAGFSLGLERMLVVMGERGMFPRSVAATPADVLVTIWNAESMDDALRLAHALRANGLRVDVYPEADKLGKQFKYAASLGVPFVAVVGDEERESGTVTIKNLQTGDQTRVDRADVARHLADARA